MRRMIALSVWIVLAGCASGTALVDETTAAPYAGLLAEAASYPRTVERVAAGPDPETGLHVQVTHVASPAHGGELVVCVNGILSAASQSFRFVEGALGRDHDLLLLDLPGCGGSDKPEYTRAGPDAYTTQWLGAHVLRAVDRWSKAKGRDDRIAFLGHSMGGAAVLRALSDPRVRAAAPDVAVRVDHLVLVSPADVVIENPSEKLADFESLDQTILDLACAFGLARPMLEDGIRGSVVEPCRDALCQEVTNFGRAIITCASRRATKAMLLRYQPLRPDGTIDQEEADRIRAAQAGLETPCLIFSGSADDVVAPENGREIAERLPNATFVCLLAKHSVHQERATELGEMTRTFLAGESVAGRPCPDPSR